MSQNMEAVFAGVRQGDAEAISNFVLAYHDEVQQIAQSILRDSAQVSKVTKETLEDGMRQVRAGVPTDGFDTLLTWFARTNAEIYAKEVPAPAAPAVQSAPAADAAAPVTPRNSARFYTDEEESARAEAAVRAMEQDAEPTLAQQAAQPTEDVDAAVEALLSGTSQPAPSAPREYRYTASMERSDAATVAQAFAAENLLPEGTKIAQTVAVEKVTDKDKKGKSSFKFTTKSDVPTEQERGLNMLFTVLLIVAIVLAAWVLLGVLRCIGVLGGFPDLGYSWFNAHLFKWF